MADRSRGVLGRASRGLVAEIDEQLTRLDAELAPHERRLAERRAVARSKGHAAGRESRGADAADLSRGCRGVSQRASGVACGRGRGGAGRAVDDGLCAPATGGS